MLDRRAFLALLLVPLLGCDSCGPPPRTTLPDLDAKRRTGDIVLDGRLDEADWTHAQSTVRFVRTMDGMPGEPRVSARMLWDDEALWVAFEVEDDYLKSTFDPQTRDPHLWEQDAVELMVDPDGDGQGYFELQVSPTGLDFDTRFDTVRQPAPFGYPSWESDLEAAIDLRGTVNDETPDEGYTVEMRIPFSSFAAGSDPAPPPAPGDTWRIALYVLDARPEGQRGVGWSAPLVGDFHVPDRFGRVTFVE